MDIRIVTVTGVTVNPTNQPVAIGRTLQFTAQVSGNNNPDSAVTWRVSSNAAGTGAVSQGTTISNTGVLSVAADETARTLFVIATSVVDPRRAVSVSVNVVVPTVTSVSISPTNQSVPVGGTLQFRATVTGTHNPSADVTWRVSSNAAGSGAVTQGTSINNNGLLRVAANETLTTIFVTATSVVDPTRAISVPVTVVTAVTPEPAPAPTPNPTVTSVTVNPPAQTAQLSGSIQFSATVTGTNNPNTAVTWRVSSNTAGTGAVTRGTTINNSGLLTIAANETNTTLYVIATSVANTAVSGRATVTITAAPQPPTAPAPTVTSVTVSPTAQTAQPDSSIQFAATVIGTNNPSTAVTWRVGPNTNGTGTVASGTSINSNGLLTIGANQGAGTLYVVATSAANTAISGRATVTITVPTPPPTGGPGGRPPGGGQPPSGGPGGRPPTETPTTPPQEPPITQPPTGGVPTVTNVTVTPETQTARTNSTLQFRATVTGTNNPSTAVIWTVSSTADGTGAVAARTVINNSGLLTIAPNESARTLYVFATAAADTNVIGIAVITIR